VTTVSTEGLSDFLLRLYAIGHQRSVPDFLPSMLNELRKYLPFDSAWWGLVTDKRNRFTFQASYVQGLPDEMPDLWLSIQEEDVIGRAVRLQPGRTRNFAPAEVDSTSGARWLSHRTGFRNVLCTQLYNPTTDQNSFLALSRHSDRTRFTSAERGFKELVMRHMDATATINRAVYLDRLREAGCNAGGTAIVDRAGFVHAQDSGFTGLVQREWPAFRGPGVPAALRRHVASRDQDFEGRLIRAAISSLGSFVLVELTPRSRLDDLTPREREVAAAFAGGESYKEISRSLGMAPATVRHHLRSIYAKLNVSNKAQMVHLVCSGRDQ
jgi:DNA-binding CsgD family transcriptional regulator